MATVMTVTIRPSMRRLRLVEVEHELADHGDGQQGQDEDGPDASGDDVGVEVARDGHQEVGEREFRPPRRAGATSDATRPSTHLLSRRRWHQPRSHGFTR